MGRTFLVDDERLNAGTWRDRLWRVVLPGLLVGMLLLPLLGLLLLWSRGPGEREVEGWRFAERLAPTEFSARPTFRQPCQGDAECDKPLVCFHSPIIQQGQCTGSGCRVDEDCAPYGVCRSIPLRGQRVALRSCVVEGTRQEGEPCLRFPASALTAYACGPELVCAGLGWCGRRCAPGVENTCPEGFFCARGDPEGPVCQPSCEGRTCPEGQRCLQQEGGVSVCVQMLGEDCDLKPCAPGRRCLAEASLHEPGRGWSYCQRSCGGAGDFTSCPGDDLCIEGTCHARCTLDRPSSCISQFCVGIDGEGNGVCRTSPEAWQLSPGWPRR